ncbi:signal recognition particle-docking protein FtsY, partial [Vibrio splendidus]
MTEKKKRGLLSWLGFGDEEQSPKTQNEANVENVEDQTEVESQVEAEVAKPTEPQSVESELAESDQALEETQEEQQPVLAEAEAE